MLSKRDDVRTRKFHSKWTFYPFTCMGQGWSTASAVCLTLMLSALLACTFIWPGVAFTASKFKLSTIFQKRLVLAALFIVQNPMLSWAEMRCCRWGSSLLAVVWINCPTIFYHQCFRSRHLVFFLTTFPLSSLRCLHFKTFVGESPVYKLL